jgi:hypothetical protein
LRRRVGDLISSHQIFTFITNEMSILCERRMRIMIMWMNFLVGKKGVIISNVKTRSSPNTHLHPFSDCSIYLLCLFCWINKFFINDSFYVFNFAEWSKCLRNSQIHISFCGIALEKKTILSLSHFLTQFHFDIIHLLCHSSYV